MATGDHARSDEFASRSRGHMLWHDSRTFTCKLCSRSGTWMCGTSSQSILRQSNLRDCEAEAEVHVMPDVSGLHRPWGECQNLQVMQYLD